MHSQDIARPPLRVTCAGSVLDEGGAEVGEWQRSARLVPGGALAVDHKRLMLDDDVQERGFGRAWYEHCETLYRREGVRWVDVHAKQVAAYVWATCGFEFDVSGRPPEALRLRALYASKLLTQRQDALSEVIAEGGLPESDHNAFVAKFADTNWLRRIAPVGAQPQGMTDAFSDYFTSPGQIADYGKDNAWLQGERKTWLGREFLIGSQWQGRKLLT